MYLIDVVGKPCQKGLYVVLVLLNGKIQLVIMLRAFIQKDLFVNWGKMGSKKSKNHVKENKYITIEVTKHNMAPIEKSSCHQHQTLIIEDVTYEDIENEVDIC